MVAYIVVAVVAVAFFGAVHMLLFVDDPFFNLSFFNVLLFVCISTFVCISRLIAFSCLFVFSSLFVFPLFVCVWSPKDDQSYHIYHIYIYIYRPV